MVMPASRIHASSLFEVALAALVRDGEESFSRTALWPLVPPPQATLLAPSQ